MKRIRDLKIGIRFGTGFGYAVVALVVRR